MEVKGLGILYTSQLSFASHISNIVSKAKQRCSYLLRKSFTSSCCTALILAFKTYDIPILEYCSSVWSPNQVSDILKIKSVQRSFTRTLMCCKGLSYKDRLSICGLLTLKRRLLADLVVFYKILHRYILTYLTDSLKFVVGPTRGHPLKIVYNGARINSCLHFFTVRTTKIWNSLPEYITAPSRSTAFARV